MKKFKVIVPATSANIGVGYDCLGVALDYYLELMVSESESIEYLENGEEFSIPLEENYISLLENLVQDGFDIDLLKENVDSQKATVYLEKLKLNKK